MGLPPPVRQAPCFVARHASRRPPPVSAPDEEQRGGADERDEQRVEAELVDAFAAGGREDDAAEDAAGDPDEDRPMQPAPLTPVTPSRARRR